MQWNFLLYNIIERKNFFYMNWKEKVYMGNSRLSNVIKVIFAIIVLLWGYTVFSLRHTEKIIPQSDIYSKAEINSALNTAARHFLPILT